MKYENFKQLDGCILQRNDTVILCGKEHKVLNRYLENQNPDPKYFKKNREVFERLGIAGDEEAEKFCTAIYGYKAQPGGWPEAEGADYEALTRLVRALMIFQTAHEAKNGPFVPEKIVVVLSSDYDAHVFADEIRVGCQSFPHARIIEILHAMAQMRNTTVHELI